MKHSIVKDSYKGLYHTTLILKGKNGKQDLCSYYACHNISSEKQNPYSYTTYWQKTHENRTPEKRVTFLT